ncbi:hypothetical protein ACTXT7_001739 [Hymenolepis weldensis]
MFKGAMLKIKVGGSDEVIREFLLTCKGTAHSVLGGKLPAELLMERTAQTINHASIPNNKTNEPAKSNKRGVFACYGGKYLRIVG